MVEKIRQFRHVEISFAPQFRNWRTARIRARNVKLEADLAERRRMVEELVHKEAARQKAEAAARSRRVTSSA